MSIFAYQGLSGEAEGLKANGGDWLCGHPQQPHCASAYLGRSP